MASSEPLWWLSADPDGSRYLHFHISEASVDREAAWVAMMTGCSFEEAEVAVRTHRAMCGAGDGEYSFGFTSFRATI